MDKVEKVAKELQQEFLKKGYDIDDAECFEVAKYNLYEDEDFDVVDYVNETLERWPETVAQYKIGDNDGSN